MSGDRSGFTLAEIAVSVAVLGLALTTLIGLNTRMLNTYFNENNRIKAGFYARYVMTMIEVEPEPPDETSKSDDLERLLDSYGYFGSDDSLKSKDERTLDGWRYQLTVQDVDLPLLEDALRRIDLEISWGESADEFYNLIYFVNSSSAAAVNDSTQGGTGQSGIGQDGISRPGTTGLGGQAPRSSGLTGNPSGGNSNPAFGNQGGSRFGAGRGGGA